MDKKSSYIWSEISEKTQILSIINVPSFKYRKEENRHPPKLVAINIADYPNLTLKNLSHFPDILMNVKQIFILNVPTLCSLEGIPSKLPYLESLKIRRTPLESLKYFPDSLPNLKKLEISKTNIQTLKYLPSELTSLEFLDLSFNKLISLKGLPHKLSALKKLNIAENQLESFADFPDKSVFVDKYPKIQKYNNPIRTLSGIKDPSLFGFFAGCEISFKGFQLCPSGMQLIQEWYEIKIKKGLVYREPTEEFPEYRLVRNRERFDTIQKFYCKTPIELAQKYVENPDSLTEGEIERLCWEGGYWEQKLLESNFPFDDPILEEISRRMSGNTKR